MLPDVTQMVHIMYIRKIYGFQLRSFKYDFWIDENIVSFFSICTIMQSKYGPQVNEHLPVSFVITLYFWAVTSGWICAFSDFVSAGWKTMW